MHKNMYAYLKTDGLNYDPEWCVKLNLKKKKKKKQQNKKGNETFWLDLLRILSPSEEMANGGGAGPKLAPVAPPSPVVVDNEANLNSVEAIYVRNANKSYGVGKRRTVILDNLDMNVKKGSM